MDNSLWDIGADVAAEELSTESDDAVAGCLLDAVRLGATWMHRDDLRSYTASLVRDIRAGERLRLKRDS